jgi:hypothetical protein
MKLAREQKYSQISATTAKAAGILERPGWEFIKITQVPTMPRTLKPLAANFANSREFFFSYSR